MSTRPLPARPSARALTRPPVSAFAPAVLWTLTSAIMGAVFAPPAAQAVGLEPGWPYTTGYSVSQSGVAAQFDNDLALEIGIASQDGYAYILNHDGSVLPGWPRYMGPALWPDQYAYFCSSPAAVDLDGDGRDELVVGNFDGRLYAFRRDGTSLPGFPVALSFMTFSTPACGDIDGDGRLEIVLGDNHGYIYAFNHDGTPCSGFPYATPYVVRNSAALGDLDGDGYDEIAITADNSSYNLVVLDGNGQMMPGFPRLIGVSGAGASPSLADIDADGQLDIVIGARDGTIHCLRHDGSYLPGWPIDAGYSTHSSAAIANLDADPELEFVFGMNDSQVRVYNHDATLLPGWPQATSYSVFSSPSIGDLDGDGVLEIVVGENTGKVYAWEIDGTPLPGFPLTDATYTIYSSPLLADLDHDGHLELLVGCNDTRIYCWDLGPDTYNPESLPWPKWRCHSDNDATVPAVDPASVAATITAARGLRVWPNPLRESTCISYRLDEAGPATITIHDASGRRVRSLERAAGGTLGARMGSAAGRSSVAGAITWDGRDDRGRTLPPGLYLVRLSAGGTAQSARVLVLR